MQRLTAAGGAWHGKSRWAHEICGNALNTLEYSNIDQDLFEVIDHAIHSGVRSSIPRIGHNFWRGKCTATPVQLLGPEAAREAVVAALEVILNLKSFPKASSGLIALVAI